MLAQEEAEESNLWRIASNRRHFLDEDKDSSGRPSGSRIVRFAVSGLGWRMGRQGLLRRRGRQLGRFPRWVLQRLSVLRRRLWVPMVGLVAADQCWGGLLSNP